MELWSFLEGTAIRKDLSEDRLNMDIEEGAKPAHDRRQEEGTWIIDLPGALNIVLPPYDSERSGQAKSISTMLADRTSQAFAYRQRPVLEALVNSLSFQSVALVEPLKNLQHDLDIELRKYDRIFIAGLIGNIGQSPFAVLPHGDLTINAKDYPESDEDSGTAPGEITKIPSDITVKLVIGNAEGPLSVQAGSTNRFNAVTSRVMANIPHHQGLMAAFSSGDRTCKLHLEIVGVGRTRLRKWAAGRIGVGGGSTDTRPIDSKWLFRDSGKESVIRGSALSHDDPQR